MRRGGEELEDEEDESGGEGQRAAEWRKMNRWDLISASKRVTREKKTDGKAKTGRTKRRTCSFSPTLPFSPSGVSLSRTHRISFSLSSSNKVKVAAESSKTDSEVDITVGPIQNVGHLFSGLSRHHCHNQTAICFLSVVLKPPNPTAAPSLSDEDKLLNLSCS